MLETTVQFYSTQHVRSRTGHEEIMKVIRH